MNLLNPNLFEILLIAVFATYRLTFMLSEETGPGEVFAKLRDRIGVKYDEHSRRYGANIFAEAVICFYCLSVWIGLGVFLMLLALQLVPLPMIVLLPFTFSGGAIFLKKWVG